jgi:hypothetical protein
MKARKCPVCDWEIKDGGKTLKSKTPELSFATTIAMRRSKTIQSNISHWRQDEHQEKH